MRISVASDGTQANGPSFEPTISATGRSVAFESYASNLVSDDTNSVYDIFLHDRLTGETTRASVLSEGEGSRGNSYGPSLSADGRYVAFFSYADLTDNDTNGTTDVFVHDWGE